jgi:hypothetical protein
MDETRPIGADANFKAIAAKKLTPSRIDQHAVGLDRVFDRNSVNILFVNYSHCLLEPLYSHQERLSCVPKHRRPLPDQAAPEDEPCRLAQSL